VKRLNFILILIVAVIYQSCSLLNQAGEYERFISSSFKLVNVEIVEIGGVDLDGIQNKAALDVGEIMTLTGRMFSGGMPTKLRANIEVTNNSPEIAAISGMEWKLNMKDTQYATGVVENRVEVQPNSKTIFQVNTEIDLLKVLQSESLPQILQVVFNMDDYEQMKKLDLELKIKPYYKSGSGMKEYPGYITLRP
jgi:hypothetical protein